jgi:hypothetical protein
MRLKLENLLAYIERIYKKNFKIHRPLKKHIPPPKKVETKKNVNLLLKMFSY